VRRDLRGTVLIVGSVVGGLAILVGVAIALSGGGDDGEETRRVVTPPERPSTTTTTFRVTTTFPSTTLPPITSPPTRPPTPATVTPGTIVVVPTSPPPTAPPTTAGPVATTTTSSAPTTTTTHPPTVEQQLADLLETTLRTDGTLPPDEQRRVAVDFDPNSDERVRVTWSLDAALTPEQQRYTARYETFALLRSIQGFAAADDQRVVLRATLPDPDTGDPMRVVRLVFEPDTLAGIDFTTLDPLTIFDVADVAEIDPVLLPTPPPTTTTSTTTTTTHP
jgi:hypothetical protein